LKSERGEEVKDEEKARCFDEEEGVGNCGTSSIVI
jgi:hypothetical protein